MTKLGKKMIAAVEEGVEKARGTSGPCPACGLNRVIVGRAHNCRPKVQAPAVSDAGCSAAVITPWAQNPKVTTIAPEVTTNTKGDNKSVDSKPIICHPESIVVTPSKRGRGRPKIVGPRPWETEGVSRKTWYKRRVKL